MSPHVTHIERTPLRHMRHLLPTPDCQRAILTDLVLWQPLCITGLASLEVTDEVNDGLRRYTTRLTYTLATRPDPDPEPMAYRLTLAGGQQLILGLDQRPYPVTTITDTHEDKPSGRASCTVQVEQKNATYPPLRLIDVTE